MSQTCFVLGIKTAAVAQSEKALERRIPFPFPFEESLNASLGRAN